MLDTPIDHNLLFAYTCCKVFCVPASCVNWALLSRCCTGLLQLLAGANVNDTTPQKKNALHIASEHDQATIAGILLQNGIDFEALDAQWNNGMRQLETFSKPSARVRNANADVVSMDTTRGNKSCA